MSINKLWSEVRKILEKGRGYSLEKKLEEKKDMIEALFRKGEKHLYVLLSNKKISVQRIRRVIAKVQEFGCDGGLVATVREATPQARKEAGANGIEIIDSKHPLIYIFDHWLVPKHRVLSEKEAKKVIEKYAGGDRALAIRIFPRILVSDPAVRILKAKPGQIIEIKRVVPSFEEIVKKYGEHAAREIYRALKMLIPSGEEVYYRVVVEE